MEAYISDEQLQNLIQDLLGHLEQRDVDGALVQAKQVLQDCNERKPYIDRTYVGRVKDQRRRTRIAQIQTMLDHMNADQVENVFVYTTNESTEPNHEAVALDAILELSRKGKRR